MPLQPKDHGDSVLNKEQTLKPLDHITVCRLSPIGRCEIRIRMLICLRKMKQPIQVFVARQGLASRNLNNIAAKCINMLQIAKYKKKSGSDVTRQGKEFKGLRVAHFSLGTSAARF